MQASKVLLGLRQDFNDENYDTVIEKAEPLLSTEYGLQAARLICMCFIKQNDSESLDEFLSQLKETQLFQLLEFERAFADFASKRDARWFLKSESQHPRAMQLKGQISYRTQHYYKAAEYLDKKELKTVEGKASLLAAASKSNFYVTQKINGEGYEFFYNLALYQFSKCQFGEALKSIMKSQELSQSQEVPEKDKLNIKLMVLATQIYTGAQPYFIASDEPDSIKNYLRIFENLYKIKLNKLDYQTIVDASQAIVEFEKYIHNMEFNEQGKQQHQLLQLTLQILCGKKFTFNLKNLDYLNFNSFQLSSFVFATMVRGLQIKQSMLKKYKKTPLQFPEYQLQQMTKRQFQQINPQLLLWQKEVQQNIQNMLKSVGAYSDVGRVGGPNFSFMQNIESNLISVNFKEVTINKIELQIIETQVQKVKKPMPQKWIKKQRKNKKVSQGQYVGDKTEISNVIVKKPVKKGRK